MITVFNRKELTSTFDMHEQVRIRELMDKNNIPHSVKVINRKSPSPFDAGSRARTGTFGENLKMEYEYIVYVRKIDYEKARAIAEGKLG